MKNVAEPLKKEIERMLFLAGGKPSTKKSVNESDKKKATPLLKEDDEDTGSLFGDFEIEFSKAEKNKSIISSGEKVVLPTAMKLAMVLNRVQAEDAKALGAYTGYVPRTPGSREDAATGQDSGTLYTKKSVEKLAGARGEISDMGKDFLPVTLPDVSPNMTDAERKQTAKWLSHSKDRFIISYAAGTLTPVGRAQIEFLARILSNNPLDYKDEKILLKSTYSNAAQSNAYGILYDYYKHVMIPIITALGNRAKYTPYDTQIDIMLTDGLEHALEQTVMGKYDPGAGNYGAWLMRTVKNKSIDQLRHATEFEFDERHVYDMLSAMKGPFEITSDLDPSKAYGNFVDAVPSKNHPGYWNYVYKNAMDALPDFSSSAKRTEEGVKSSPLKSDHLLNPSMFYKGTGRDLTGAEMDAEHSYEMETELFPIKRLPEDAKIQIEIILDKIADKVIANYKDYGLKNIASSLRGNTNRDLFIDIMFGLLNYGGFGDVYVNSFIDKNGSTYAAGTVAKKDEAGAVIKDKDGRVPETKKVWMTKTTGVDSAMDDFAIKLLEKATQKYGEGSIPLHFKDNPVDFIRKIYGALKYYFGFRGLDNPIVKTERDKLNSIISNYEQATLAETRKLRMIVSKMLSEVMSKIQTK